MNREEELTDILRKVEWGQLASTVAFDRILRLFSVMGQSEQLPPSTETMNNHIVWDENQDGKLPPSI